MSAFIPSAEQQAIFDAVLDTTDNVAVAALAGTGKTTVLVELAKRLPARGSKVFCAFNKSIVGELEQRLKGTGMGAKTFHSMGYGVLAKHLDAKGLNPDGAKYKRLVEAWMETNEALRLVIDEAVQNAGEDAPADMRGELYKDTAKLFTGLLNFLRLKLVAWDDKAALDDLIDCYQLDNTFEPAIRDMVLNAVPDVMAQAETRLKENVELDFTDMIYWVVKWGLKITQYDWVFVDELQDQSPMQRAMIQKSLHSTGRIVMVGDKHQCQPPGTMVRLKDGVSECPIEELFKDARVMSYDRRSSAFVRDNVVTDIAVRHYTGPLMIIDANGQQTRCTPNHKWLVRWTNKSSDVWATYLMKKGNRFRVGVTQLFHRTPVAFNFGVGVRARVERAEAAWVLRLHSSYADAIAHEQVVAARFGLPQMVFYAPSVNHFQTPELIDYVYDQIGDLTTSADLCLKAHGRQIEYPIWTNGYAQRQGRRTLFETQACNLISDYMAVPHAPNLVTTANRSPSWHAIKMECEHYDGPVFSLNIERHHKYVADGFVTCNSIYAFAGADSDSFDLSVAMFDAKVLPLTVTRRCAAIITKHATQLVPAFTARDNAPRGKIVALPEGNLVRIATPGDLILCRTKSPLVKACLDLLAADKPATILGSDIGKALVALLEKAQKRRGYTFSDLRHHLIAYQNEQVAKWRAKDDEAAAEAIQDQCGALLVIHERANAASGDDLVTYIERLFSDDDKANQIVLSTVHKSKGLEAERVMILAPEKLPLAYPGMSRESIQQEINLDYVARTRAKNVLVYLANGKWSPGSVLEPYFQTTFDDVFPETAAADIALLPAATEEPGVKIHPWAKALLEKDYLVLDLETTGVVGEPVQIVISDDNGVVLMNQLVKPYKHAIEPGAQDLHGISPEAVENAPGFSQVYMELKRLLENKTVVAYNAPFEEKTLEHTCQIYGRDMIEGITWECAMRAYADFNPAKVNKWGKSGAWWRLEEAANEEGITAPGKAHNALTDVYLTLGLLRKMAGITEPLTVEEQADESAAAETPHEEPDGTSPWMIENQRHMPAGADWLTYSPVIPPHEPNHRPESFTPELPPVLPESTLNKIMVSPHDVIAPLTEGIDLGAVINRPNETPTVLLFPPAIMALVDAMLETHQAIMVNGKSATQLFHLQQTLKDQKLAFADAVITSCTSAVITEFSDAIKTGKERVSV